MSAPKHLTIAQLIATPGTTWGGMEKHTADLSEALASRGHVVHVLAHPIYQHRFFTRDQLPPIARSVGAAKPIA